jgi:maltooligosyltrehalose trehalohydrolase
VSPHPEWEHAPLGAVVDGDTTTFRVWAPAARTVDVVLRDRVVPMEAEAGGRFAITARAGAGERYRFRLDGDAALPDPMSRAQPDGVQGPSQIVAPTELEWTDTEWSGLRLDTLTIYELHVGTFSREGTFDGARTHLRAIADLGVTAIEIMPVATFPGSRGWGYDGLYTGAPHPAYGGPEGLARLVDAAHATGLGVILDVVYNHLGPGSEAVTAFGPYTTDAHHTLWGGAIDFAQPSVREWAIQNAESWVRDYHVDGLRLDAVNAMFDDSDPHVMAELATRVHAIAPRTIVISETDTDDTRPIEQWGHDAQWGDALHHAVHVLLTGEHDGYYESYGKVADLARELERADARRLVVCAQNHDQVGNRAVGDRLQGRKLRLAAFCAILAPGVPLLFMGEEYDEHHPFLFFTDHIDTEIANATREGRRREFEKFTAFAGEDVPDPQAAETFVRSKLDRSAGDPAHRDYYHWLLARRRSLPAGPVATIVDEDARVLEVRRGGVVLKMNFSDVEHDGVPPWEGVVR